MRPGSFKTSFLFLALATLLLTAWPLARGARPAPAGDTGDIGVVSSAGSSAPRTAAYHRRLLLDPTSSDAATGLDPAAAVAGTLWASQLDEYLAQLAEGGLSLGSSHQQQQQAMDLLIADAEALADEVITATRSGLDSLAAQLLGIIPEDTSAAGMARLLHSADFHERLKGVVSAAVDLVTEALQPHLAVVAQSAHSTLRQLLAAPEQLGAVQAFSDSFVPMFADKFALNVVEAALLHSLWQDS